jgi:hypothetical protein
MSLSTLMNERELLGKKFLDREISGEQYEKERRALDREIAKRTKDNAPTSKSRYDSEWFLYQ